MSQTTWSPPWVAVRRKLAPEMPKPAADRSVYRMPKGPRTPRIVNGLGFLFGRNHFLRLLQRRYGDVFTVPVSAFGDIVVVNDPALVKKIFTAKPNQLHAGKNPLGEVLGTGSLFSMDGDEHLKERRMLLPPLHGDRMRAYYGLVEEEAVAAMDQWPEGIEFPTIETFNRITLRIILRAVFGAEDQQLAQLERMMPEFTKVGQRLVTAPALRKPMGRRSPGARYAALHAEYLEAVSELVEAHLADPDRAERTDILALMLAAIEADPDREIDRAAIADELLTLLVAGHETTASSLAWTVERLRRNPSVLRRLGREAAEGGSELRTATILEVHRVRPVIGSPGRLVMEPFELGPYVLAPGSTIMPSASLMHADDRYHERAAEFDPDRYMDGAKPDTYAWIPFGGGVRRCVGAAFATMEMDIVLRVMLERFELAPTTAKPEAQIFKGVAFGPSKGGRASVRRRREPLRQTVAETAAGGEELACPMGHVGAASETTAAI